MSVAARVRILAGPQHVDGEWLANPTADAISKHFPLRGFAQRWGDEIYFDTAVAIEATGLTEELAAGDIAYWPQGRAICVFFGKTPASRDDRPRPAGPVTLVGRVIGDCSVLRKVAGGTGVTLKAI